MSAAARFPLSEPQALFPGPVSRPLTRPRREPNMLFSKEMTAVSIEVKAPKAAAEKPAKDAGKPAK